MLDVEWLETEGPDEGFLKGLIQAAICLHHFQHGNLEGARKLYAGHRRLLAPYLPAHRGVDLVAFLADMQRALRPVVRPEPHAPPPELDPARAPRLRPVGTERS